MSIGFLIAVVGSLFAFSASGEIAGLDAATIGFNLVIAGALVLALAVVRRLGGGAPSVHPGPATGPPARLARIRGWIVRGGH
ncbi:hypothetical protein HJD18_03700 [Thermoleophilia bacterium SCSIO 60948]|nr:hypothetical protein HJD18_03700 [Thermoleophilia bacterium SCSIO 60948]